MIKYYVNKKAATMQVIKNYNSEYTVGILWNVLENLINIQLELIL